MKFILDENVPIILIKSLRNEGHDAVRVTLSSPDPEIALRAKNEERILITQDKDFVSGAVVVPPSVTVVFLQIHPPTPRRIDERFMLFLKSVSEVELNGVIILRSDRHIHIP